MDYFIRLKLTEACGKRCLHCVDSQRYRSTSQEISLPWLTRLVEVLRQQKADRHYLTLTGGEPTESPNFATVWQMLHELAPTHLILATHAEWAAKAGAPWLDLLKKYPPLELFVSLDGDQAAHNRLRDDHQSFNKVVAGIQALAATCPRAIFSINTVVGNENRNDWRGVHQLLQPLPVQVLRLYRLEADPKASASPSTPLNDGQWSRLQDEVGELNRASQQAERRLLIFCHDRQGAPRSAQAVKIMVEPPNRLTIQGGANQAAALKAFAPLIEALA